MKSVLITYLLLQAFAKLYASSELNLTTTPLNVEFTTDYGDEFEPGLVRFPVNRAKLSPTSATEPIPEYVTGYYEDSDEIPETQGLSGNAFYRRRLTTTTKQPTVSFKTYNQMQNEPMSIPEGSCGVNVKMSSNQRSESTNSRITRGLTANVDDFPWQARIEVVPYGGDDAGQIFLCSGAIIAEKWLISAAHCFWEEGSIKAYVGGEKFASSTANRAYEMNVEDVFLHPRFNEDSLDYDIALVQLSDPLIYSDKIQPICLPRRCSSDCEPGNTAVIAGWGAVSEEATEAETTLRHGNVTLVRSNVCQRGLDRQRIQHTVTNRMICAGDPIGGTDTCKGDDGSPLACIPRGSGKYLLTGVKSLIGMCGQQGVYSVYTQPCRVLSWIESITGGIMNTKATKPPATRPAGASSPTTKATTTISSPTTTGKVTTTTKTVKTSTKVSSLSTTTVKTTAVTKPPSTSAKLTTLTTTKSIIVEPDLLPVSRGWQNHPLCGRRNGPEMNAQSFKKLLAQVKNNITVGRSPQTRIVGGVDARRNEFPWQVRITTPEEDGFFGLCGGSLINEQWVLTAGHCVEPDEIWGKNITVHLGSHNMYETDDNELQILAYDYMPHPSYDPYEENSFHNDIALILLSEPVEFTDKISPVCLLGSDCAGAAAIDSQCTITGWGRTAERGYMAEILQKATVNRVSPQDCQSSYDTLHRGVKIFDGQICAGYIQGGIDTCQGDSGGPLVCKHSNYSGNAYFLNGITSFGEGCARPNLYGVYSRPCHYMEWISCLVDGGNMDECDAAEVKRKNDRNRKAERINLKTTTKQAGSRAGQVTTRRQNFLTGRNTPSRASATSVRRQVSTARTTKRRPTSRNK